MYRIINDPEEIDRKAWADFVNNHPNGNIFQSPNMFEVYENSPLQKPYIFACYDLNSELCGILLANILKVSSGFTGIFSSRSIIQGGPLIKNELPEIFELIIQYYNRFIKNKVIYSQFRNQWVSKHTDVFLKNGYEYEDHLNIYIDLTKSQEVLWNELHTNRKKNLKKSTKALVEIKEIQQANELKDGYEILKEVYKNANVPLAPEQFFKNAWNVLQKENLIKIFGAYHGRELLGIRLILCYKNVITDWYAGSFQKHYNKYPNDLLLWEIFLWGRNNKYELFDFGGAGKPSVPYGVRDYKIKFGGNLVNFGRFENIHKPLIYKFSLIGYSIWKLFRRIV
jgi:serine/alanine adding enzyme